MPQHARFFWGKHIGRTKFNLAWRVINHQSVVLISASEGQQPITTAAPERFVESATFVVGNIAPQDGNVSFVVLIDWFEPLNLWTDITVFDRGDPIVQGHVPFHVG